MGNLTSSDPSLQSTITIWYNQNQIINKLMDIVKICIVNDPYKLVDNAN